MACVHEYRAASFSTSTDLRGNTTDTLAADVGADAGPDPAAAAVPSLSPPPTPRAPAAWTFGFRPSRSAEADPVAAAAAAAAVAGAVVVVVAVVAAAAVAASGGM